MSEIGITSVELRKRPKDRNKNSVGRPVPAVEYRLDENGVLYVKGDSICKKIIINGELFESDEWFCTGDVMEEKDGYYYILGRNGDRVITESGENINPDTIEASLKLSDADAFSVVGIGEGSDERLSLVVSVNPYLSGSRLQSLMDEAYEKNAALPLTTQIKDFYFTNDPIAPPTAIKVGRSYLKKAIKEGRVTLIPFSSMKACADSEGQNSLSDNPLAVRIRKIIAEQLGLPEEKVADDTHVIFDLGATSLQYFSVLSALSDEFGATEISDKDKYCYTVREFTKYYSENI